MKGGPRARTEPGVVKCSKNDGTYKERLKSSEMLRDSDAPEEEFYMQ